MTNPYRAVPLATIEGEYHADNSVYLKMSTNDLSSLALALASTLAGYGIGIVHETIVSNTGEEPHPNSHIGTLVSLYRRVDAALHGRKTWNAAYRATAPHNSMKVSR